VSLVVEVAVEQTHKQVKAVEVLVVFLKAPPFRFQQGHTRLLSVLVERGTMLATHPL